MEFRPYDALRDEASVIRIWRECGWPDPEGNASRLAAFRSFLSSCRADVAVLEDQAEALVTGHTGTMWMLDTPLPFLGVTAALVGRSSRRRGASAGLIARTLERAAMNGLVLAGLGIFDQGYYEKLGFGSFPYIREVSLDPLKLKVPALKRTPVRLSINDVVRMSDNMEKRVRVHGQVSISSPEFVLMDMLETDGAFGLGFEDPEGRLTHHFWARSEGESGPCEIRSLVYRNNRELLELLALMKNLGDQINCYRLREPPGIQIQDLLERPFRAGEISSGGPFRNGITATAWQQARILRLEPVMEAMRIPRGRIEFNLELTDPILSILPEDSRWRGLGGDWVIALDEEGSEAVPGRLEGLPLMKASVNAFTRLVFGVLPASGLEATDQLTAPGALVSDLDRGLRLPVPDMVQDI